MNKNELLELQKLKIFNEAFGCKYSLIEFYAHHTEKDLNDCWGLHNTVLTYRSIGHLVTNGCEKLECIHCPLKKSSKFCKILSNMSKSKHK